MTAASEGNAPKDSLEVRARLEHALHLDLVGPSPGDAWAEERLPAWEKPSNRYLTGFLIPSGTDPAKASDADEDDEMEAVPEDAGLPEESTEERKAAKKGFFPSSMGLSFLVAGAARHLKVVVRWGEYKLVEMQGDGKKGWMWQREPHEAEQLLELPAQGNPTPWVIDGGAGLQIQAVVRRIDSPELKGRIPDGTLSVSLFLINHRQPGDVPDLDIVFQAGIEVHCEMPFIPRPDPRGIQARELDESGTLKPWGPGLLKSDCGLAKPPPLMLWARRETTARIPHAQRPVNIKPTRSRSPRPSRWNPARGAMRASRNIPSR